MLLTIATTHRPATDLGYLLHKNPERVQSFSIASGQAHLFYPEATDERCTVAVLLDIDPIALVRRGPTSVTEYVNDRPYVASSQMAVALSRVFGTAMKGRSDERPELASTPIPLEVRIAVLPCRGGERVLRELFEPLGWQVEAEQHDLDPLVAEKSRYFTVALSGTQRLADLLNHLAVLIPVLDDSKHYWVGDDEIDKLMRRGEGWLPDHPHRELISRRYLKHRRALVAEAMARLLEEEGEANVEQEASAQPEEAFEERVALNKQRLDLVAEALATVGCKTVLDLGCGEGKLLRRLVTDRSFERLMGVDVSPQLLERASRRLELDRRPDGRVQLLHSSLLYRDKRLRGFDGAAVVEVVEHIEPDRLGDFEAAIFGFAAPATVVLTTPNADYNVRYPGLDAGRFRHSDHRFEWTRAEFTTWATGTAERYGYVVRFSGVGEEDPDVGFPTQMAIFEGAQVGIDEEPG